MYYINILKKIIINSQKIGIKYIILPLVDNASIKNINQENQLLKILPKKHIKKAHHLILLHGRYTCKSRNPLCTKCVINKICVYKGKNV